MKNKPKFLRLMFVLVMASVYSLAGCEEKGEFEKAGENVDEAMKDMKRKVEDATD